MAMSGALAEMWDQRGHHAEALRRYLALLEADEQPTPARAKALSGASMEATKSGDIPLAMRLGEEELSLQRSLGNRRGEASALWGIGYLHLESGDGATAEAELRQSLEIFRELGDETLQGWVTRTLAHLHYRNGDLTLARPLYEENRARARAAGDTGLEATTLDALATIALREGRTDEARALMSEALQIFRGVGDPLFRTAGLGSAAVILADLGHPALAASLLGHCAARYEELEAREPWVERMNEETAATIRHVLDPVELESATEEGRRLTYDDATQLALAALGTGGEAADAPPPAAE
jgi:tetratricopeptide (TPR) repeat protein